MRPIAFSIPKRVAEEGLDAGVKLVVAGELVIVEGDGLSERTWEPFEHGAQRLARPVRPAW
jgi:hypothetical protein